MSRTVTRLTVDHLAALPEGCPHCVFWELDPVRRRRVPKGEELAERETWVSTVLREWGSCGRTVLIDGEVAGYVIYAPPAFVPGAAGFATSPVSPDALLMSRLAVATAHRGGGLGRILIQGMVRDLVERGDIRAIEAFGDTRGATYGGCALPADFLHAVGFKTQRAHSVTPRMRMEMRSAVSWKTELEIALERMRGVVRPAAHKRPAPEAGRWGARRQK